MLLQVLTSCPYQDPHNVGIMTSYGPQAMVCKEVACIYLCCDTITVGGTTTSESDALTLKTRFCCTRDCPIQGRSATVVNYLFHWNIISFYVKVSSSRLGLAQEI